MNKEIYNNNQLYDNSNKDINYIDQNYQNNYKNVLQKFKDNIIKVRSNPNSGKGIEMSSQLSSTKSPSGENNNNDTDDEDVLKKFQIDSYMKKRRKRLEKHSLDKEHGFSLVKNQLKQQFSLYKLGKIEWAKEHASANRPLNKLQQFTKQTKFCNCCNLPCETPGIMERFSACENTENFSVCGKGVPLYFLFFRYCILVLILVLLVMSIPMTILNHNHLVEIEKFCDYRQNNYNFYSEDESFNKTCEKYIRSNESFATNFLNWFWKLDNLIDYKNIIYNMINYKFINNTYSIIKEEKEKQFFLNFSFIGFYCMITLFIINIYFIILLKGRLQMDKKENVQPSDYTLLITDLQRMVKEFKDKNEGSINDDSNDSQDNLTGGVSDYEYNNMNYLKTKIGQFTQFLMDTIFYNEKSKQNLNIFNLNLCFKLNEFMVLKEKSEKCKYKIFQVDNNPSQIKKNNKNTTDHNKRRYYTSPFTLIGLNWLFCSNKGVPIDSLYRELEHYDNELNLLVTKAKLDNFCGCIFATFNTIKDKSEFYNKYPHFLIEHIFHYIKNTGYYLCCCLIDKKSMAKYRNRQRMKIHLAPEPEDVIWENMEFTFCQRFKRIIIIYSLTILLIIIAFQIVFTLNKLQGSIKVENWAVILKYSANFSISIVISILNAFLQFILRIFTQMEKQKSKSYYYLSYSIKLTFFTLTTSAFVPFLSNYINQLGEYNNKTLINNMLMLFLVNSFFTPLIWTLNINLIIKKIKIYFIEKNKYMHFKTQKELNDIYELPDMNIAMKYSYLFKTVLMTMFFLPIFPIGVPISLLGLILAYFLEKYNFTHHYKRPEMLNQKLGKFYFNFFICIFLSYCFGNYIFSWLAKLDDSWSIISLIFFGVLSVIPYTKPISYYFNINKDFNLDSKSMSDMYFSFCNDYQRQNPFTKKEGMYFYITELKRRGYISKFIYDILLKNIEKINVMEIYYDTCIKPNLTQTQTALARINNNNFNMEDMKKSIRRAFKEREEKLKMKKRISKRLNTEIPKNLLIKKEKEKEKEIEKKETEKERKEREKKEKKEQKEREKKEKKERKEREKKEKKSLEMVEMIEDNGDEKEKNKNLEENKKENIGNLNKNINIDEMVNNINSINDDDNSNDKNKRKNTGTQNKELKIDNLYDQESLDCSLSEAFTDKGSFIINQYKNPLLLNIGLGIQNLAFMGKNEIKRSNAIKGEDEIEEPEEDDFSITLLEEKE